MIHHLNRPSVPRSLLLASLSALLTLTLSSLASSSPHPPDPARGVPRSHRLIVELDAPPLARDPLAQSLLRRQRGTPLDWNQPTLSRIAAERTAAQTRAFSLLSAKAPGLRQSECLSADGSRRPLRYQLVFNGFTVESDAATPLDSLRQSLADTPGVKAVHYDYAHSPDMFASLPLIHATSAWARIGGGISNAGAGIKIASMDGGVHHAAPMFAGDGFAYPADFPPGGLGETNNNNGKIIASRAYFRDWDPPVEGEQYAWPGPIGTSHGVHTSGIMAGIPVQAHYLDGPTVNLSGVAPAAWILSYKVFCGTQAGNETFYSAEGIAALEDILADGAQILNNSWGGGPEARDAFDPLGTAVQNVAAAGVFTSFSAGNSGPQRGTLDHSGTEYISVASLPFTLFQPYAAWADALGIPAAQRAYDDDPFSNGIPNLVAYATGIPPSSPDRPPLSIASSNGSPLLTIPWRTDIDTAVWFRVESSTNLLDPAWPTETNLAWQSLPLSSNRAEWIGLPNFYPLPPKKNPSAFASASTTDPPPPLPHWTSESASFLAPAASVRYS